MSRVYETAPAQYYETSYTLILLVSMYKKANRKLLSQRNEVRLPSLDNRSPNTRAMREVLVGQLRAEEKKELAELRAFDDIDTL